MFEDYKKAIDEFYDKVFAKECVKEGNEYGN